MPKLEKFDIDVVMLQQQPEKFITTLRDTIAETRRMVWLIIANKKVPGFDNAEKLVRAYNHLDKAHGIFKVYQPPLPLKEKEAKGEKDAKTPVLPDHGS